MQTSPMETLASIRSLRHLLAKDLLTAPEEQEMELAVRRQLPWRDWLDRGLLALGSALVLSGVVYFFAHNWDHLTNADKLGMAGGAIVVSFLAAAWRGFDDLIGKVLLFAASALVGVFIAVFGQVYQTGADSYELFTLWAMLILPWVLLGRFMPLWILWVAVLNFAWGFYLPVSDLWFGFDGDVLFRTGLIGFTVINGTALLVREAVAARGVAWLDNGWASRLLLAATMFFASFTVLNYILLDWENHETAGARLVARMIYALLVVGLGYFYSRVRHSLSALAIVTLATCCVLTGQAGKIVGLDGGQDLAAKLLAQGVVTLMIFGAGIFFLRSQRRTGHI